MKKLKIIFPLFIAIFMVSSGFYHVQDRADEILQGSKTTFEALKDFSASFSISIQNINTRRAAFTKSGQIKYKKGKYYIGLEGEEIYYDGETQWVYLTEDKEVNIMTYDRDDAPSVELIFEIYSTNSKPRYDGEESVNGNACHKIFIASTDRSVEYNQVRLWINKSTNLLEKMVLLDRNQTTTTYLFSNIKTNTNLLDSSFKLDVSKLGSDIEIYDERD